MNVIVSTNEVSTRANHSALFESIKKLLLQLGFDVAEISDELLNNRLMTNPILAHSQVLNADSSLDRNISHLVWLGVVAFSVVECQSKSDFNSLRPQIPSELRSMINFDEIYESLKD